MYTAAKTELEHRHCINQIPSQLKQQVITHHDALLCWSKKAKII
jgi:hypothetical protein